MLALENKNEFICENLSRNAEGELCLAGMELSPLARKLVQQKKKKNFQRLHQNVVFRPRNLLLNQHVEQHLNTTL